MPPRKPARRLADRRPNRRDRRVVLVLGGLQEAPQPPSGLLPASRADWEAFWGSELSRWVQEPDRPALVRLWQERDEYARARRALRGGRFVLGSKGQPVLSPAAVYLDRLSVSIKALEDRFGLSPLARFRLGHEVGQAGRSLSDLAREIEGEENDDEDPRFVAIEGKERT